MNPGRLNSDVWTRIYAGEKTDPKFFVNATLLDF